MIQIRANYSIQAQNLISILFTTSTVCFTTKAHQEIFLLQS